MPTRSAFPDHGPRGGAPVYSCAKITPDASAQLKVLFDRCFISSRWSFGSTTRYLTEYPPIGMGTLNARPDLLYRRYPDSRSALSSET